MDVGDIFIVLIWIFEKKIIFILEKKIQNKSVIILEKALMLYMSLLIKFNSRSRAGIKYAEDHGLGAMIDGAWKPTKRLLVNAELVVLPSVFQKNISGYITHVCVCYTQ